MTSIPNEAPRGPDHVALGTARAILRGELHPPGGEVGRALIGALVANYDSLSTRTAVLAATLAEVEATGWVALARAKMHAALNRAVDDIGKEIGYITKETDLTNLVVNVALHYFDHPDEGLEQAVAEAYDKNLDEVLGWLR